MSKIEVNTVDAQCGSTVTIGSAGKTVSVPGNVVKTNALQASDGGNIVNQCGTTVTLGASGDTIALASGASQTGFGRTGTVDWITTPKVTGDSPITGVTGKGYFLDTTSGTITINLPAGAAGSIVSMADYARTWQTNNVTVAPNGAEKIGGVAADATLAVKGQSATFVYVDGTQGWINIQETQTSQTGLTDFIMATVSGACNTLTTAPDCANMKLATFVGPGTFCVSSVAVCAADNVVSYLAIAGGGGGGGGYQTGGGGAGGYREVISPTSPYSGSPLDGYPTPGNRITVTVQGYPIASGGGGAGGGPASPPTAGNRGTCGVNSTFGGMTAAGGGSGGAFANASPTVLEVGGPGGSGGGSGRSPATNAGGTGNTPPVSPAQGTAGGPAQPPYGAPFNGGGGGGAICAGGPGTSSCYGVGGNGTPSSITGSAVTRAGGGGSGGDGPACTGSTAGGGGNGASTPGTQIAQAGTANKGGGGGGGQINGAIPTSAGGNGGSGIVIIRYKFQ